MKKVLALCALFAGSMLSAQTVLDVTSILQLASKTPTLLQTITGTDGNVCTLTKEPGSSIWLLWGCNGSNGTQTRTAQLTATSTTAASSVFLNQGIAACLIGLNPTAAAVSMGSLGSVPAKGAAWSCTPDMATILTGTVTWP